MRVLVTGATGKGGNAIASALIERGDQVRGLVRDPDRPASLLPAGSEPLLAEYPKGTAYERSKQHAEELVLAERDGMEVVIRNPSGVYGPTAAPTPAFENGIFEPVVRKRLPALPPGGTGYAFVEGVAAGHLLAAEQGADGERYIVADGYSSFREIAETVKEVAGRGRVPPVMPVPLARAAAAVGEGVSRVIRRPPLLPRGQLTYFLWQAHPDSTKAQC